VGGKTAGEAARIVVRRTDSGATLPGRGSRACSGRHCSGGSSGLVARPRTSCRRRAQRRAKMAEWTGVAGVTNGHISSYVTRFACVSSKIAHVSHLERPGGAGEEEQHASAHQPTPWRNHLGTASAGNVGIRAPTLYHSPLPAHHRDSVIAW